MDKKHPFPGNVTRHVNDWTNSDERPVEINIEPAEGLVTANVLTSEFHCTDDKCSDNSLHRPVLDIDFPAKLIESSTKDHYHLMLDRVLSWDQYVKVLDVLAEVGILEQGYVDASKDRGYTAVRLPWVKKVDDSEGAKPLPTDLIIEQVNDTFEQDLHRAIYVEPLE